MRSKSDGSAEVHVYGGCSSPHQRGIMNKPKFTIQHSFFFEGLTLLFIALKLMQVIDWPWLWILAPLWAPVLIAIVFVFVGFIILYSLGRWGGK